MKNRIKLFRKQINSGKIKEAQQLFPNVVSIIDKTVRKGTIHKRTGSRYKSRLNLLLKKSSIKA
jgi:small subunit ribosomal protein S20